MHGVLRVLVIAEILTLALIHDVARLIYQLKADLVLIGAEERCFLLTFKKIAHLICENIRTFPDFWENVVVLITCKVDKRHIVKGDDSPRRETAAGCILTITAQMESPFCHIYIL